MESSTLYGIPRPAWAKILEVLEQQPKIQGIRLFGSRAKGNFRPGSDIDLCIDAEALSLSEKFALETALDDLLLPWKVDLAVWQMIDQPALKEHIERVGIELDKNGDRFIF
ncbi:Predicted nucleotidyltransferase [Ectothiorhodosinus mongolicus]|uniref:Predicted nucleotidyltransferase n=1 Tax=Ectothiorhodosinus mongolicus TaxID=233100 RepID=A0A1R3VMI3_9GAMM|nr:nucleotidyltransferase domain-containing protein [Ectothiorhodosinus mongolicus]ULX58057.1 nucleotidyltransferase domain-containing protein [Ectothiorhodosinus mongolicus]SIT65704.1 Predicted nucleotidyltransferase [Ectothiorhodosinus mongolicus]